MGPHRPHIEPITYHCALHKHTDPPHLYREWVGLYLSICLFFVVLVLCLSVILQPYMVAEAYWFWKMHHHLPLTRHEIHLGSPKPTDVPPPEGPDRPPPG